MDEFPHGIAMAWSFPPLPAILILVAALLYLRGWRKLRSTRAQEIPRWRALSFLLGLLSLWIALASPIDALDDFLLSAHMFQHFILMSVAPPLLVLGCPVVPFLRGLPRGLIRALRPFFSLRFVHKLARATVHPATAWMAMNIAYLGWHIPAAFELTLHSETWHSLEHLCFLFTSIAFWWVILAPWPSQPHGSRWILVPYLLTADLVNTVLSAVLAFSGRVLYPSYAEAERVTRLTPLQDQVLAGSEMWVLNSLAFLVPAAAIVFILLRPRILQASHMEISGLADS